MNSLLLRKILLLGFSRLGFALFLVVLGSRLAVFSYAGSPLPYYDQWFSDFNNTLMTIADGKGFEVLLISHNEHLLITTKTLTLVGYAINGYWDVLFLASCAAGVRALTAAWTFELIADTAQPRTRIQLWLLCVVVFSTPYSGFNVLNGMQVCFYLVDLALLWSLRVTTNWAAPVTSGLALVGGTLFGVSSLASAVAIPACTLAAHLFQQRARPGFWPAWMISAAIALAFIVSRIPLAEAISATHPPIPPQTMVHSWLRMMSWPVTLASVGALFVPFFVTVLLIAYRHDRCRNGTNAVVLGLGVYAVINAAFIAISREPSKLHMRYFETLAFLPLAVLSFGILLANLNFPRRPVMLITGIFALGYIFYAGNLVRNISWPYIEAAHRTRLTALEHYRSLLLQQNFDEENARLYALAKKQGYAFFDDPIGRFTVPPIVLDNLVFSHHRPLVLLSPEIIPGRSPSTFSWFTNKLITYGWVLGLLGIILGIGSRRETKSQ